MNNVEKTAWKIQASCPQGRVLTIDQALVVANALEEAGLLAPAPQIVRTMEELEALDPDSCTLDKYGDFEFAKYWLDGNGRMFEGHVDFLPAIVFATGSQVRAAREAMEKEND